MCWDIEVITVRMQARTRDVYLKPSRHSVVFIQLTIQLVTGIKGHWERNWPFTSICDRGYECMELYLNPSHTFHGLALNATQGQTHVCYIKHKVFSAVYFITEDSDMYTCSCGLTTRHCNVHYFST